MSINCSRLLVLKHFERMKLVAGKSGLDRKLSWPYVGQTTHVSEWVHGGELLFITGIGRDNSADSLVALVKECVSKRLCGLVILIGSEYIKEIPQKVISAAERLGLPLFEMPWDLKLIDVTSEIVDLLMADKLEQRKIENFLSRLLFPEPGQRMDIQELADIYHIKLNPYGFIAILHIDCDLHTGENLMHIDNVADSIQKTLDNLCKQNGISFVCTASGSSILCFISSENEQVSTRAEEYLKSAYQLVGHMYPEERLYLSIGRTYTDGTDMEKSYREARQALELNKKLKYDQRILSYSQLGFYRLLLKIDREEIRQYYQYELGALIRHDVENHSELTATLGCYLRNDSNLIKTSQELFIHRNTLIYRLNKIREISGKNLDDAMVKLELLNSIMAKEYLGE